MYIIGENTRVQQCLTLPKLREVIWMEQAKKQIHGEWFIPEGIQPLSTTARSLCSWVTRNMEWQRYQRKKLQSAEKLT